MSNTLAQLRTKTREMVDEATASRWSDSILNSYICDNIALITEDLASSGSNQFHQSTDLTASNGTIDISALNVLRIVNLSISLGGGIFQVVNQQRPADVFLANSGYSGTFKMVYISKPVLPVVDGDTITYGNTQTTSDVLDKLVAVLAARNALIKDNEVRPGLETLKQELEKRVFSFPDDPTSYIMRTPQWPPINRSIFNYARLDPDTITLFVRY